MAFNWATNGRTSPELRTALTIWSIIRSRFESSRRSGVGRGEGLPRPPAAAPAMIRAAVGHGFFNGGADALQIVRKIARIQVGLDGHHAAADVHADRSGNDRALGGNNASYRGTDTPMHVRHGGHPLENERELGDVPKLCPGLVFERHALGPRLDEIGRASCRE